VVILNGVDVPSGVEVSEWRRRIRQQLGIGPSCEVVVYVGNLRPEKDPECLAAAFDRILSERRDASVLLIGRAPAGAERTSGVKAIEAMPRVRFLGEVPDPRPFLCVADALVLSSRSEGCPTVVVEALACGVPVASTDVGDLREIVGEAGVIVPVGDGVALGASVVRLLQDRASFTAVGERTRQRIIRLCDRREITRAFVREYLSLCGTATMLTPPARPPAANR
jgi:glycosyltransferase involved in cell wall biosynthesis